MLYLAREIELLGGRAILLDPSQIDWTDHSATARCQWFCGELDCLYRFFPAEWLPNLRRTCGWENFFTNTHIAQCNPGAALISQSKRFGLVCENRRDLTPTWNTLLPQTREIRGLDTRSREWVFKPAFGRVGDGIGLAGATSEKDWREIRRDMFFSPGAWIAQRRFEMLPLDTPLGPQFVCLGVYTVDGVADGIYARCSPNPIINHISRDVAVLLATNR
jgi:glutathionylspermidine synthase